MEFTTYNGFFSYADYLRSFFNGKQEGDIFEIDTLGKSLAVTRATIKNVINPNVKTKKTQDKKLMVMILKQKDNRLSTI